MSKPTRTLIALPIPGDRKGKLSRLQSLVAAEVPGARWVDPDQLHVTLAFLGDVDVAALAPVCRAVAEAAAEFSPFELRLETLGVFPAPVKPRTIWVGLTGEGVDVLREVQKKVVEAVGRAGYPPEDNRFSPHVTLGRIKAGRGPDLDLTALLRHYQTWSAGSFTVEEIVTFASTLTPDGPAYSALARAPLEGGKTLAPP